MVWFCMLLAIDLVGFGIVFAAWAGWGVSLRVYDWSRILLFYFGSVTLVLHLIRFAIARALGPSGSLSLGMRIERSLVQAAALLALSTSVFTVRRAFGGAAIILGAAGMVCASVLIVVRFRHYIRWRTIRLRRESRRWE